MYKKPLKASANKRPIASPNKPEPCAKKSRVSKAARGKSEPAVPEETLERLVATDNPSEPTREKKILDDLVGTMVMPVETLAAEDLVLDCITRCIRLGLVVCFPKKIYLHVCTCIRTHQTFMLSERGSTRKYRT